MLIFTAHSVTHQCCLTKGMKQ
uniref:Uncharacterized protein n=1 Tax=Anguilla anguilla TaxID=7936 RepID=A0A0E9QF06_ANGAN